MSEDNIRNLWRTLPRENTVMTREQMTVRAHKFQAKHKRLDRLEYAGWAIVIAWTIYVHLQHSGWQNWAISILMIGGAAIAIWNYFRFARQSSSVPANSTDSLLTFMRRALTRQRDAAATSWRWYVLPLLPAVLFIFGNGWVQADTDLAALTQRRISLLFAAALAFVFLIAYMLWQFLRAAHYQRALDGLAGEEREDRR